MTEYIMKKRFISLFLVVIMITITIFTPFQVYATKNGTNQKTTDQLNQILETAPASEEIPIMVELLDVDDTMMEKRLRDDYPKEAELYDALNSNPLIDVEMDAVQKLLAAKRKIYKDLYDESNGRALSDICSILDVGNELVQFCSSYSPFIFMRLKPESITKILTLDCIISIDYDPPMEAEDELSYMTKVSRSKYLRDNMSLLGSGVGVGMIEAYGFPSTSNTSYTELYGKSIILDPNVSLTYDSHAAKVASIIIGKNNGCAPSATLYATHVADTGSSFYERIEWLLSRTSPVVSIINMSMGYGASSTYDSRAKWVDHIAMQHDVHFVKSSGNYHSTNNPNLIVTSPGLAYNGITVGAYYPNKSQPWDTSYSTLSTYSCWLTGSTTAVKPDLVSPGGDTSGVNEYSISGLGTSHGTSFSCAMVSGLSAQLISCNPALATQQRALKAILLATAWKTLDSASGSTAISGSSYLYSKQGVGKIDGKNAYYTIVNALYRQALLASGDFPYTCTAYFSSSASSARVSLVWLKRNKITGSHSGGTPSNPSISDLDLYVYDPNGNLVGSSTTTRGNVEIVQFSPSTSGYYTIKVTRASGTTTEDAFAVAWW